MGGPRDERPRDLASVRAPPAVALRKRRWESLFVNNRFNFILRFGGRQEEERVILTNFAVDSVGNFPRFVFYDIDDTGYH